MSTTDVQTGSQRSAQTRKKSAATDWRHLEGLFNQLPPHAIEAEASLLGSILIDPRVLGDIVQIIRNEDDFSRPVHGVIYRHMVELYDELGQLDIVQLNQLLVDRNLLDEVGGTGYLVELANAVPSAANATYYARLVRDKAMIRQIIDAAGQTLYDAYNSPDQATAILDQAEQRIFHVAQQYESLEVENLAGLIEQAIKSFEDSDGRASGEPTGYHELDDLMGGLQKGEVIIVAARPSMGKTALGLNVAEQMGVRGIPVGVFSLEMSKQALVHRLLCARANIDSQRLRRNTLQGPDYNRFYAACGELKEAPIYIDDTPGLTLLQLRAKARRLVSKYGIRAILIDYLQLLSVGGRVESRQIEVSEISRGIKAMARELNIPVICLAQLNRGSEQREGHRPRMSDLRESGSIEQDADVIVLLHREDYYHQGDDEWIEMNADKVNLAELIIAKQRNGPTGVVKLTWCRESTRFKEYTGRVAPPDYDSISAFENGQSRANGHGHHSKPAPDPFDASRSTRDDDTHAGDDDALGGIPF